MRKQPVLILGLFAAAFTCLLALPARAQQEIEADAGVITLNATVQAIDVQNQLLTVVGPAGNIVVVKATPEVVGRVKVKEKIIIRYSDEVAMALRKAEGPPVNRDNAISREEEGGMNMNAPTAAEQTWTEAEPDGATELTTIELTAEVLNIDYANRIVKLKGPGGTTRVISVDPSVQGLDAIKPGDTVVLEITRAVAVEVKGA